MKKGVASNLVVIVLSLAILISGVLLIRNVSKVTAALPSPQQYFFTSSIYPERGTPGTVFTIRIYVGEINRSNIYRINAIIKKDNLTLESIPLFDDSLHGDVKENDGIYANIFDSAGKDEGVYSIDVEINPLENKEAYRDAASFQIYKKNCINLKYTGNPSDKIDLVVVPSGYHDFSKFVNDVMRHLDFNSEHKGLFALEPFKSNIDKFNIYIVNSTEDLGCNLGCQGIESMICCNDNKVSEVASQCPSDTIIVLHDSKSFCGTASYYAKVCAISRGPEVLTHEFGHSFCGLGDEYDYSVYYPTYNPGEYNYPNCDLIEGCPRWSGMGLEGVGCFKGCGISNAYRPTKKDCIMYAYVGKFDPVDEIYIRRLLESYKVSKAESMLAPPVEKSYLVNLNYKGGQLKLNDVYVTEAVSPDRKAQIKFDYKAKIISFDDTVLDVFNFEMPRIEYPFYNPDNDTFRPSPIVYGEVNRLIIAPYYKNANRMEVYNLNNSKILEVNLAQFSNLCGNGKCENTENVEQCPADCKEAKRDKLCVYIKDDVCDFDCQSIDPDCKKLSPLIIANIVAFIIFITLLLIIIFRKK